MNRRLAAMTLVGVVLALAGGCAEEEQRAARDARAGYPRAIPQGRREGPTPTVAKPVNTATPYSFLVPWVGVWRWSGDTTFVVSLDQNRHIQYGPLFAGTYRLVDDRTIELTIEGKNGERPGPILFRMEFAEGGQLMAWSQGAATLVFQRVSVTPPQ